jgi:WD40 repeat protein
MIAGQPVMKSERLLRDMLAYFATRGDFAAASAAASELVNVLLDKGRPHEGLQVVEQLADCTQQAGCAPQLSIEVLRLHIFNALGRHREVLSRITELRAQMQKLPDPLLDVGRRAALRLGKWEQALNLNAELCQNLENQRASLLVQTRARFNDAGPLLRLRQYDKVRKLLEGCRAVFEQEKSIDDLGRVFLALSDLEDGLGHAAAAKRFGESALRFVYMCSSVEGVAICHHNFAISLAQTGADQSDVIAHRLAAAIIRVSTGLGGGFSLKHPSQLGDDIIPIAGDLQRSGALAALILPADFAALCTKVEKVEGVRFREMMRTLVPDEDRLSAAVREIIARATEINNRQVTIVPKQLFDGPVLAIDPGMHTAVINSCDIDAAGRWAVTGSDDKTVRVWSLVDGTLLRTIRLPSGPGNVGQAYAVAMSPDGALIAVGGWTKATEADRQEQIYLFDCASGRLVRRIDGLPNNVTYLVFSPDGCRLAAMLSRDGLRIYGRERDWAELARDVDYGKDHSYGADFAPDGRLATTAWDGKVRLYANDCVGNIRPIHTITLTDDLPSGIVFSPDGSHLAVGSEKASIVTLLNGRDLSPSWADLRVLDPSIGDRSRFEQVPTNNLSRVAWSRDGQTLFAAGRCFPTAGTLSYDVLTFTVGNDAIRTPLWAGQNTTSVPASLILAWSIGGPVHTFPAGQNTVVRLVTLPEGDLLVAAQDPWLARLQADGSPHWMHGPRQADFRELCNTLAVSNDGTRVRFGVAAAGKLTAQFDLVTRTLTHDPPPDGEMALPRRDEKLFIAGWRNTFDPSIEGRSLPLHHHELSRSLAVHPTGDSFVLGTEWSLRAFDSKGALLWRRAVPGVVWSVNITGDGRLVVAACGDRTIRWHRMTDGVELLAFMPLSDQTNWVAWTPEGFYAATGGAHGILRWHVNRGWDAPAESVPVADIPGSFRPTVLPLVLQELETPRALGWAVLAEHNKEVALRTYSGVPPGTQLHLLTIGISTYNEDYAKHLRLKYAARDAQDLASAIVSTQGSLYSRVLPQVLLDQDANKAGILRALNTMRIEMSADGNDLAVVHFSGHGAIIDGKLYLLLQDVDARDPVSIKASALPIDDLKSELLELAKNGRVLVLLDACHSGATTMDGTALAMDATALRTGLAAANVTVLTSSSGREVSQEDPKWQHGAFTKVLLDALTDHATDTDHNGLITPNELAQYVDMRVVSLTNGRQTPGMEVRFNTTVFALPL